MGACVVDDKTVATGQPGHKLLVAGVLKKKTLIVSRDITIGYCHLEFGDAGNPSSDPVLRHGHRRIQEPRIWKYRRHKRLACLRPDCKCALQNGRQGAVCRHSMKSMR